MANRLSMATIHSIQTLYRSGHSNREIARLLGIDRGTVNTHVRRLQAAAGHEGAAGVHHTAGVGAVRRGTDALLRHHLGLTLPSSLK